MVTNSGCGTSLPGDEAQLSYCCPGPVPCFPHVWNEENPLWRIAVSFSVVAYVKCRGRRQEGQQGLATPLQAEMLCLVTGSNRMASHLSIAKCILRGAVPVPEEAVGSYHGQGLLSLPLGRVLAALDPSHSLSHQDSPLQLTERIAPLSPSPGLRSCAPDTRTR